MRQLDESLKRLKTDRLDCWQMHNVRTSQDVEAIFASDGALMAFMKARGEKVTRFIGITGHRNPFVLMDAMGYVLTLRVSTVIIGIKTVAELEENVRIAQSFKPFGPEAVAGLEDLTRPYYEEATFFKRRKGY
jgi:aryl-alcohol dehydrogenase-like predicted oxidoreductase